MLNEFAEHLRSLGKSENTIKTYCRDASLFLSWCADSFGEEPRLLYRANVLEYISYMRNIRNYNPRTVNNHLSSLRRLNAYLVASGRQEEFTVLDGDFMKIQLQYASPCTVEQKDVEAFRQRLLEGGNKRDYAIVTLYTYSGIRRSECVNLKLEDIDLTAKELRIVGKGDKHRLVYLNDKIVHAVREYLKVRDSDSPYLFVSRQSGKLNPSRINQIFNQDSVWQIYRQLHEYTEGIDSYEELNEFIDLPEVSELPPDTISEESQYEETADPIQWPEVDFDALREINPDIVGWIYIEGTEINYPVVQGEDNQYYLKHLFSGEWNSSGCIFLDCRNAVDFSDSHSIIYGHHMKNGAMFCDLDHYKIPIITDSPVSDQNKT